MKNFTFALASLTLLTSGCEQPTDSARAAQSNAFVKIDTATTHQTIDGWELSARIWEMDKENNAYDGTWLEFREEIADGIVNQAGLNRIRLPIRSGAENPVDYCRKFFAGELSYLDFKASFYQKQNDNEDPRSATLSRFQWSCIDYYVENLVLPIKHLLEARGERLFVVLTYVDFDRKTVGSDVSHAENSEEFAELIENTFVHLRNKYKFTPDAFEIVLEPDLTKDWRSNQIVNGLLAVDQRLKKLQIRPDYIAPSTSRISQNDKYFSAFLTNPEALSLLSMIGYHRYDYKKVNKHLPDFLKLAEDNNLETGMLEFVYANMDDLIDDLTIANVSAWQKFGVPFKAIRAVNREGSTLEFFHDFQIMALMFRNVRRGAVRLDAASSVESIRPLAFRNKNGHHAIFLYFSSAEHSGPISVTIEGAPAGEFMQMFARLDGISELETITTRHDETTSITLTEDGLLALIEVTDN